MCFFFFNDTATTEIYTLSLHDALPISAAAVPRVYLDYAGFSPVDPRVVAVMRPFLEGGVGNPGAPHSLGLEARSHRSEEHTSELQSQSNLVCRLLLEKKSNHS